MKSTFGVCFASALALLPAQIAVSDSLLLVDIHEMPVTCPNPSACIESASPVMTNILSLSNEQASVLTRVLNSNSVIRGLPQQTTAGICRARLAPELQELPVAEKITPLINHPGVFFDSTRLDKTDETVDFANKLRAVFKKIGLKILTEEEWQNTPGRPVLSLSFSPRRESEGCIIPFNVMLTIKEEVVLVRDPSIKLLSNAWSGVVRENLTNRHFTHHSALNELLEKFEKDFLKANSS